MAVRESIRGLSQSAEKLDALRAAFARIQRLGDDRGFAWLAGLHGLALPSWCEHGRTIGNSLQQSPLFLPWHRAYLYFFELALQSRLGPRLSLRDPLEPALADVGLPWWNWANEISHTEGIPPAYADPLADGSPNPLASSSIATANDPVTVGVWSTPLLGAVRAQLPGSVTDADPPTTRRDPDLPDDLPRQRTLDDIVLQQPTFEAFSNSLELVHNDVHGWVGGSMTAVPTAAFEPIFWSHHSMVDRLWSLWQNGPNGQNPPAEMLDTVLAPFPMTVAQTLDINLLGYDYAVVAFG